MAGRQIDLLTAGKIFSGHILKYFVAAHPCTSDFLLLALYDYLHCCTGLEKSELSLLAIETYAVNV
jgi:hypothetical protein